MRRYMQIKDVQIHTVSVHQMTSKVRVLVISPAMLTFYHHILGFQAGCPIKNNKWFCADATAGGSRCHPFHVVVFSSESNVL